MAHGGMLSAAAALFPRAPQPFVDLSTGINPVAYPMIWDESVFARLPDPADEAMLLKVAAAAYGVADPGMVVAMPGTQVAISLLPHLLGGVRAVAILSPTYGEHAAAWAQAGHVVREVAALEDLAGADVAVLCHPNNPDGRRFPIKALGALADRMAAGGGLLVVDEAFADFEPGVSVAELLPHPGLVIFRSFGKSYGLAGVRLGFVLCAPALAARLRAVLGPWAVSGPALAAGLQALPDSTWRAEACARLDRDGARLDALMAGLGLSLVGGTRLFRLYEGDAAAAVHRRLGQAGILVRRFEGVARRLRLGLPGTVKDWARVEAAWVGE